MKCPDCGKTMTADFENGEDGDIPVWVCLCGYYRRRKGKVVIQ